MKKLTAKYNSAEKQWFVSIAWDDAVGQGSSIASAFADLQANLSGMALTMARDAYQSLADRGLRPPSPPTTGMS